MNNDVSNRISAIPMSSYLLAGCVIAAVALMIAGQWLLHDDGTAPAAAPPADAPVALRAAPPPKPVPPADAPAAPSIFTETAVLQASADAPAAPAPAAPPNPLEERLKAQHPPERRLCATLVRRDAASCQRLRGMGKLQNAELCDASARARLEACNEGQGLPALNYIP